MTSIETDKSMSVDHPRTVRPEPIYPSFLLYGTSSVHSDRLEVYLQDHYHHQKYMCVVGPLTDAQEAKQQNDPAYTARLLTLQELQAYLQEVAEREQKSRDGTRGVWLYRLQFYPSSRPDFVRLGLRPLLDDEKRKLDTCCQVEYGASEAMLGHTEVTLAAMTAVCEIITADPIGARYISQIGAYCARLKAEDGVSGLDIATLDEQFWQFAQGRRVRVSTPASKKYRDDVVTGIFNRMDREWLAQGDLEHLVVPNLYQKYVTPEGKSLLIPPGALELSPKEFNHSLSIYEDAWADDWSLPPLQLGEASSFRLAEIRTEQRKMIHHSPTSNNGGVPAPKYFYYGLARGEPNSWVNGPSTICPVVKVKVISSESKQKDSEELHSDDEVAWLEGSDAASSRVSRAHFKMEEVFHYLDAHDEEFAHSAVSASTERMETKLSRWGWWRQNQFDVGTRPRACDVGAAPGGWTLSLAQRGCYVTAVDPGPLHVVHKHVVHVQTKVQEPSAIEVLKARGPFDIVVCDMNAEFQTAVQMAFDVFLKHQLLKTDSILVITAKNIQNRRWLQTKTSSGAVHLPTLSDSEVIRFLDLTLRGQDSQTSNTEHITPTADVSGSGSETPSFTAVTREIFQTYFSDISIIWLLANRNERTIIARRNHIPYEH